MIQREERSREKVPVRENVTKKLIAVPSDAPIRKAAKRMVDFEISAIDVSDDDRIVGFLTDADLKRRVVAAGLPTDRPVAEIMRTDPITAGIDSAVEEVMEIMADHRSKHVLITDGGRIAGIVTLMDTVNIERRKLVTSIGRE